MLSVSSPRKSKTTGLIPRTAQIRQPCRWLYGGGGRAEGSALGILGGDFYWDLGHVVWILRHAGHMDTSPSPESHKGMRVQRLGSRINQCLESQWNVMTVDDRNPA